MDKNWSTMPAPLMPARRKRSPPSPGPAATKAESLRQVYLAKRNLDRAVNSIMSDYASLTAPAPCFVRGGRKLGSLTQSQTATSAPLDDETDDGGDGIVHSPNTFENLALAHNTFNRVEKEVAAAGSRPRPEDTWPAVFANRENGYQIDYQSVRESKQPEPSLPSPRMKI